MPYHGIGGASAPPMIEKKGNVMTKRVFKKLKSRRGASFLLALLFFLLCSMVASSILMSSVSNAGKINSNKEEHQTYFILSSAVQLICDDLNQSKYQGKYTYIVETEVDWPDLYETKKIIQKEGSYDGILAGSLQKDFDSLFASEMKQTKPDDVVAEGLKEAAILPHTLKIKTQTGTAMDEAVVQVELKVVDSYAVEMVASLDGYTILAEITPNSTKPTLSALLTPGTYETEPMEWKIGWITVDGYE